MLEQELALYKKLKLQLQEENPFGGFVVIKNNEVLGVWQSRMDALRAGIDKYGDVSFLVKNINEQDTIINYSRDLVFNS